jgi:hypothetical protein
MQSCAVETDGYKEAFYKDPCLECLDWMQCFPIFLARLPDILDLRVQAVTRGLLLLHLPMLAPRCDSFHFPLTTNVSNIRPQRGIGLRLQ